MTLERIAWYLVFANAESIFKILPEYLKEPGHTLSDIENLDVLSDNTLLDFAISKKHIRLVNLLIQDYKVDVNKSDRSGSTPLIGAAQHSNLEIVRLLIQAGAQVGHKNKQGHFALLNALRFITNQEDVEIIKLLINHHPNHIFKLTDEPYSRDILHTIMDCPFSKLEYQKEVIFYLISKGLQIEPLLESGSFSKETLEKLKSFIQKPVEKSLPAILHNPLHKQTLEKPQPIKKVTLRPAI